MNFPFRQYRGFVFLPENIGESLIDFAQPDLDLQVWNKDSHGRYSLAPTAEAAIMEFIASYPSGDLLAQIDNLHIVGSITTNQYSDDADIDVHIFPKNPEMWDENKVWGVKGWFDNNKVFIGKHPIEIFVQLNPSTDYLSPGFYDVTNHKWIKGPKVMPEDYDPYDDFSDIAGELKNSVTSADLLIGELKRDVIDFETVQKAMNNMSSENKQKFLAALEIKLKEIEEDIDSLVQHKDKWVFNRRLKAEPISPEIALKDVELAKQWRDSNAIFKFIGRYHYITVINKLRQLVKDDDDVSSNDVDVIKGIIGA